jgi:hypothetical protein
MKFQYRLYAHYIPFFLVPSPFLGSQTWFNTNTSAGHLLSKPFFGG